ILPNSRMTLRSVSTRNRPIWRLPPFGALTAASTIRWMSSIGIGSGLNRRTERWVNIASPIGIFSRSNAIRSLLPACELCAPQAVAGLGPRRPRRGYKQSDLRVARVPVGGLLVGVTHAKHRRLVERPAGDLD